MQKSFFYKIRITILFILLLSINTFPQQKEIEDFFYKTDNFFQKYVTNGLVKYKDITKDKTLLEQLTSLIEKIEMDKIKNSNRLKAYLINVYNILVIDEIVNNYPTNSPKNIPGFFNSIPHKIGKKEYTLDEIEKELLFKKFHDPRFHFALVCAAVSCPEILNSAYKPSVIEKMLNSKAKHTVNNNKHVKLDKKNKKVYLSKIFEWYKTDFAKNGRSVIDYINLFRNKKLDKNISIEYLNYNWALNEENVPELDLQSLSPSALLPNGQVELKMFNNLYTQTSYYDSDSEKKEQGNRSNFLTSIISATYGFNSTINFGLDLWLRSSSEVEEFSSPFGLFSLNAKRQRTAISRFGPRIKFVPFKNGVLQNVSVQSSFLIPTVSNLSGTDKYFYLDDDAFIFVNQFLYDATLKNNLSLYAELAIWMKLQRDDIFKNVNYNIPLKIFVNYYLTHKFTLYAMNEFNYGFNSFNNSFFNQTGIGAKYLILSNIELEGLFTKFLFGKNAGAGSTFNLGIRLVY